MDCFSESLILMGNRFTITVVAAQQQQAKQHIESAVSEIRRIEQLLSTFKPDSQTNLINDHAGLDPVRVDREVFDLIARSIALSRITQGAFDLSYGSIDKSLWNFDPDMKALPSPEQARWMVHLVDYRNIILDSAQNTVWLKNKGMRIGFGGIGKGYAAEMAKNLLRSQGVSSGIS